MERGGDESVSWNGDLEQILFSRNVSEVRGGVSGRVYVC